MTEYYTKRWKIEAFQYDPWGEKPQWFLDMIALGLVYEYKPRNESEKAYCEYGDKRSTHKCFTGDWAYRDEFGRFDVWSGKNFFRRIES